MIETTTHFFFFDRIVDNILVFMVFAHKNMTHPALKQKALTPTLWLNNVPKSVNLAQAFFDRCHSRSINLVETR